MATLYHYLYQFVNFRCNCCGCLVPRCNCKSTQNAAIHSMLLPPPPTHATTSLSREDSGSDSLCTPSSALYTRSASLAGPQRALSAHGEYREIKALEPKIAKKTHSICAARRAKAMHAQARVRVRLLRVMLHSCRRRRHYLLGSARLGSARVACSARAG